MTDVVGELARLEASGEDAVLATIVATRGSTPGQEGAMLLVRPDGGIIGTVGGGCLEADVWARGRGVLETGRSALLHFDLTDIEAHGSGLICGGRVEVLVEAFRGGASTVFRALDEARRAGRDTVIAAVVDETSEVPRRVLMDGHGEVLAGGLPTGVDGQVVVAAAREALLDERPRALVQAGLRLHVEPYAVPTVTIFGAGHVGAAIARFALVVGFRVVLADDRAAYADPARHPGCACVVGSPPEIFERLDLGRTSYCVVVTRGHVQDEPCLDGALRAGARYIGLIGSRVKIARTFQRLQEGGRPRAGLAAVRAPMGLGIGARTSEEIALATVAEMVAVRRGAADTRPLRESRGVLSTRPA